MSNDQPRPAAASSDTEYSLSIENVAARYDEAGLPRDRRTIQRYCAKGNLDCHRVEIPFGEKYFVTPASVSRHIAYIKEVRQAVAGRDEPRQVAQEIEPSNSGDGAAPNHGEPRPVATPKDQKSAEHDERQGATSTDQPRQTATADEMVSRYVARLEGENEFLRGQVTVKDKQIGELTERARETNFLIGGLQKMLSPLLGGPAAPSEDRPRPYPFDASPSGGSSNANTGDNSERDQ
jgi:hypothetical protein